MGAFGCVSRLGRFLGRMGLAVWAAAFLLLAVAAPLGAESGGRGSLAALDGYIATALENNADLKAAHAAWQAAVERVPQAGVPPDPRFTYGYFIRPIETRTGPQRQRFGLFQTLPWFGKLSLKEKQAALEADAQFTKVEALRLKIIGQVKDAYYEYAYAGQAVDITCENIELLGYLESVAEARYAGGLTPYAQLVKLQVEQGKVEDRLHNLEDLKVPLRARLNTAMNRTSEAPIPMPAEVPVMIADMTDAEILAAIQESNPELKGLDILSQAAQAGVDQAERNFYPDFTFGLELIQQDRARVGNPDNNGDDPLLASVSINIPLWQESRRAAARESQSRKQSYREQRTGTLDRLYAAVQLALYRYRDAGRRIDLYRETLLPKAEQGLGATLEAFQSGSQSALDLVDAERTLLEFQLAYLRALADQGQRMAEMEVLLGREIPCKVHSVRPGTRPVNALHP